MLSFYSTLPTTGHAKQTFLNSLTSLLSPAGQILREEVTVASQSGSLCAPGQLQVWAEGAAGVSVPSSLYAPIQQCGRVDVGRN